jgi:Holliday junction resolvase RusA-like endonuclease
MLSSETIRLLYDEEADGVSCRAAIVADYNQATGEALLPDQLDDNQLDAIVAWLRRTELFAQFVHKRPILAQNYFESLESKASWHAQRPCGSCRTEFPVQVVPVLYRAFSAQYVESRIAKAFRAAFADQHRDLFEERIEGTVCVRLVFVLDDRRPARLDVDNLAKSVLDAAKGVLFGDDSDVAHLEVLKLRSFGDVDRFAIRVAPTRLGSLENVLRPRVEGRVLVNELDLGPYL